MCEELYCKIYIITYLTQTPTEGDQYVMQEQHQWLARSIDEVLKFVKQQKLNRFNVDCQAVLVSQIEDILAQQSSSSAQ